MDIYQILTTVGFLIAVVPHIKNLYSYIYRVRIFNVFWDSKNKDYIIIYPVHEDLSSPTKELRLIKHETVSAGRRIEEFLKSNGCKVTVKRSNETLNDAEKQCNIVIIGSSRTNLIVNSHFPSLETTFEFCVENNEYCIVDKRAQIKLASPLDKGIEADLALITKIPNPFSPQQTTRVYYLAGIHAIGCWAAAEYVTDYSKLKKLPRCSQLQGLSFIIEAKFSGFYNIVDFSDYVAPRLTT